MTSSKSTASPSVNSQEATSLAWFSAKRNAHIICNTKEMSAFCKI